MVLINFQIFLKIFFVDNFFKVRKSIKFIQIFFYFLFSSEDILNDELGEANVNEDIADDDDWLLSDGGTYKYY